MVPRFKWLFVLVVLAAAVLSVGTALATDSSGLRRTVLARATLEPFHLQTPDFKIHSKNTADVVVQQVTFEVDGHTGWHTHFGPAFILVKSGQIARTRADGCTTQVFGPGEGFVEASDDVHIARNVGTGRAEIIGTYTNVPIGQGTSTSVAAPRNCP